MIQPAPPRATIFDEPDGLRITIPARPRLITVMVLVIWCVTWVAWIWSAAVWEEFPFGSSAAGMAGFACLAGLVSAGILFLISRVFSGREVVMIGGATLTVSPLLVPLSRRKTFDGSHVRGLRAIPLSTDLPEAIFWTGMYFPGLVGGHIAFDYGARTYRFGAGVDEAEAKQIVKRILERYPALGEPTR